MTKSFSRLGGILAGILALPLCFGITACSDGRIGSATLTSIFTSQQTITMDAGQTTSLTVSLTNDGMPGGATFSAVGGGSFSPTSTATSGSTKKVSVQYTAPLVTSTTPVTVTATSVSAPSKTASIAITVNPTVVLKTSSLPTGTVSVAYDVLPSATGGTGALTWSVQSGPLPAGLTLASSTGEISGTPTTAGTYTFTLAVTDSAPTPVTAVQTYTVVINSQPPVVTAASLPSGVVGTAYSQQLSYTGGGTGAAAWAITAGTLPPSSGLTLSPSGLISGTPSAVSTYTFSVAVTVGTQTSGPVSFTLKVYNPVVVTTTSLPAAHLNVAYSQQLAYTGGDGSSATWKLVSGALPSTITLSSTGTLSGTPPPAGTYTLGVAVTVGTQTSPTQNLTLSVVSTQITSAAMASGEVGVPFAFQIAAVGGTAPYIYSLATGSLALPAGLSINSSTGLISGTPTTNTGSPFSGVVVQARDALGAIGTQSMTFTVAASRGAAGNSELNGLYAFLLTGFDAAGNPVDSVGSFTADGNGHITAGVADVNGTALAAPQSAVALTASAYAVGADGRGQLTLASAAGSATYVLTVNMFAGGVASAGALTQFDATGRRLTGQFVRQTASAFNVAAINSGFAFGAYGFAANSSATSLASSAMIGELQFSGANALSSSELTTSTAGAGAPITPTAGTLTVGANGRGTLALVLPSSGGTMNFVVYVISASRMFLLSSDPASGSTANVRALLAGDAAAQTIANGTFANASLTGTGIFHEDKLLSLGASTYGAEAQIGIYTFDGAGNITGLMDRNSNGTVTTAQNLAGTYAVAANGRVTAQVGSYGFGGCLDCTRPTQIFYLAGPTRAYLLDFASTVGTGSLEPQTTATFSASSFTGAYSLGTDAPLAASATPESGLLAVGSSTVTGLLDQATPGALTPDVSLGASASIAANGRVTVTSGGTSAGVLYLASPSRGFWLDTAGSTPVLREINHQ